LVYKEDQSRVRELSHEERIEEITRIISGEANHFFAEVLRPWIEFRVTILVRVTLWIN